MDHKLLDNFQEADILSQSGNCTIRLARYLLTLKEQDRIIPKGELAKEYKLGVGTIQGSLQKLQEVGAVQLVSKGHMGTFVEALDRGLLWNYSLYGYVRGTMPLPYSSVLTGLATGIACAFTGEDGMLHRMSYMRGSRIRIKNLQAGLDDFTICSEFAASRAIAEDPSLSTLLSLGDNTYMGDSVFLMRKGAALSDGVRLGVDHSSYDQELLTKIACQGIKAEFVKSGYNNLFRMIEEGKIDGALWSSKDLKDKSFTGEIVPISAHVEEIRKAGAAVILVHESSMEKMRIVQSLFQREKIVKVQQDVIAGKIIPNY